MSDKNLTELEWKKFAKGRNLKDAVFVKALAALELAKTPDAQLAALDEIDKQADLLRKANKGDKEITSYLDDADKAASKERKQAELEAKKAAKKADDSAGDEDEASPAQLSGKMIPLLRAVPKGESMKALIAVGSKECGVLISRKAIGAPQRKVLLEFLGVSGGLKYITGECIWEANAHTFVVQASASGLAKKIKAAVLAQTDMRVKVRVRGEDPNDIDDDGDPPEAQERKESESSEGLTTATAPGALDDDATAFNTRLAALMPKVKEALVAAGPNATDVKLKISEAGVFAHKKAFTQANALLDEAEALMSKPAIPKAPPMPTPKEAPTAAPTVPDADATAFNARLAALMPKVKEVLVAAGPIANDVKLKVSEAGMSARKKEFSTGQALLDEVERLLAGGHAAPTTASAPSETSQGSFVNYAKARLAWVDARKQVEAELKKLESAIVEAYSDTPELAEARAATRNLDLILSSLDVALADKLDEGLNAADPQARSVINQQAATIIARYQGFVASSPLVREIDNNPFVPVNVAELVISTLDDLERQLA